MDIDVNVIEFVSNGLYDGDCGIIGKEYAPPFNSIDEGQHL